MLQDLKLMLGIDPSDSDLDTILTLILSHASARLKIRLGGIEPPDELEYIIVNVAAIRFNCIGSEGLSSHSIEGESLSFSDDDFSQYKSEIQAYLESQKNGKRGKVRFL